VFLIWIKGNEINVFRWGWPAAIIAAIGHGQHPIRLTRMPLSLKRFSTMRLQLRANNNPNPGNSASP
jgi:hypothetical protein